jgi:6-phosphogluconolactonase (cycloisomerase 2 family)
MKAHVLAVQLGLVAAACGGSALTSPPVSTPTPVATPTPPIRAACADGMAGPASLPSGTTVAVMGTDDRELTLFAVDDRSGCWLRLDDSEAPSPISRLAAHPSGRYVFASGEVASGKAGIAAYGIAPERAMIDGLGASWMEQQWWDRAGSMAVAADGVYLLTVGPHTGYHGGVWRWAFDTGDGGLTWRGMASVSKDPFFLLSSADRRFVYLGTEPTDNSRADTLRVLEVGRGGALSEVGVTVLDTQSAAVVDPTGRFVWVAVPGRTRRLLAYRATPEGPLAGPVSTVEWPGSAPVVHPSGTVLYSATAAEVQAYVVDRGTGAPRLVAHVPFAAGDFPQLAVDPAGRYVYVILRSEVHAFQAAAPDVNAMENGPDAYLEEFGRVGPGGSTALLMRVP